MSTQPIFDFHARLVPVPAARDRLLAAMDQHGIARAAVVAGGMIDLDRLSSQVMEGGGVETDADNDAVLAGCEGSDGRLVPVYFANPHRDPDDYRRVAARFRGVEISPAVHGVPLVDERMTALVDVAAEFGHSVYIVYIMRDGSNVPDVIDLAKRYPDVNFVLGHCGFTDIDFWSINLVAPHRNISMETSGGYTTVVRTAIDRLGADRVVFGTEYPLQHPSVELTKYAALDLDPDTWTQVAWRNAHRLLGEEQQ